MHQDPAARPPDLICGKATHTSAAGGMGRTLSHSQGWGTQPAYSKDRPALLLGTRVTRRLKDKEDKTQLVTELSMVSESADLDLVLFAFFRNVHPWPPSLCLLLFCSN